MKRRLRMLVGDYALLKREIISEGVAEERIYFGRHCVVAEVWEEITELTVETKKGIKKVLETAITNQRTGRAKITYEIR